jgi:biotin carboxylase
MPRVAVIGGRHHAVKYARELGVDVVLVHEPGRYEDEFARDCERIVHADTTDGSAVTEALLPLHRQRPFDRVLSTTDLGTVPAGEATDALGLPGNGGRTARTLKDKSLTRRLLVEHDLAPVRFRVVRSGAEIADLLGEVGGRVVVKPLDGSGSADVHVVTDAHEAELAAKAMAAAGYPRVIAEEYLDGPVITVEAFSANGRHLTLGLTEETVNGCHTEVGITAPSRVTGPYEQAARELTTRLLDAAGVVEGPSHTELVLTAAGPRILESHNRMAGVGIPELIRRAYGVDENRWFLSVPLGLEELPARPPEPVGGAAIRFFEPPPGSLVSVTGLDRVDGSVLHVAPGARTFGFPGLFDEHAGADVGVTVQVNPGDQIRAIRTGWDLCVGFVIASGPDAHAAAARCDEVLGTVRFYTR